MRKILSFLCFLLLIGFVSGNDSLTGDIIGYEGDSLKKTGSDFIKSDYLRLGSFDVSNPIFIFFALIVFFIIVILVVRALRREVV